MSHFPFVLQEQLGTAPPRDQHLRERVDKPTSATPATFNSLNWSHAENGPTNPVPEAGVVTFMGPAITTAAGCGEKWPKHRVRALVMAHDILTRNGLCFEIPKDFTPDDGTKKEDMNKHEIILSFIRQGNYDPMEFTKDNEVQVCISDFSDWIYIRCSNESVSAMVEDKFQQHFSLGRIEHTKTVLVERDDIIVTQRTGNETIQSTRCSPGTYFELKKGNKIVSKSVCTYHNCEMDNEGPTVELFETAAEWRGHGYATQLLEAIKSFYYEAFEHVIEQNGHIKFNVCYVTNYAASQWFQNRGFSDWDGMGEELGMYFCGDDDFDDDDVF